MDLTQSQTFIKKKSEVNMETEEGLMCPRAKECRQKPEKARQ